MRNHRARNRRRGRLAKAGGNRRRSGIARMRIRGGEQRAHRIRLHSVQRRAGVARRSIRARFGAPAEWSRFHWRRGAATKALGATATPARWHRSLRRRSLDARRAAHGTSHERSACADLLPRAGNGIRRRRRRRPGKSAAINRRPPRAERTVAVPRSLPGAAARPRKQGILYLGAFDTSSAMILPGGRLTFASFATLRAIESLSAPGAGLSTSIALVL